MKNCPFSGKDCTDDCALFISSADLNENVVNKLNSIGVMNKVLGGCAIKNIALSEMRRVFENTNTGSSRF